jgi:hypothetical protein
MMKQSKTNSMAFSPQANYTKPPPPVGEYIMIGWLNKLRAVKWV